MGNETPHGEIPDNFPLVEDEDEWDDFNPENPEFCNFWEILTWCHRHPGRSSSIALKPSSALRLGRRKGGDVRLLSSVRQPRHALRRPQRGRDRRPKHDGPQVRKAR